MPIGTIEIGGLSVSRLMIGGNPFSGNSHQNPEEDLAMRRFFTTQRIKDTLKQAEGLGINTLIARADHHIMRVLLEYWDEGGGIQWLAQTCPEVGTISRGVQNAIAGGAKACYVHGGVMDFLLANNQLEEIPEAVAMIREAGLPAGVAGHNPAVFEWAEDNLEVDFYMCSYYNPTSRDENAEHISGRAEWFRAEDRERMAGSIKNLSKPAIHYKIMAAGRNDPREALAFVARHLRPGDAVCVGVYPQDHPRMLEEDLWLLEENLRPLGE